MDLLPSSNFHYNEKTEKRNQPLLEGAGGCYIFLVKSGKISLRISLVGLVAQIKELRID